MSETSDPYWVKLEQVIQSTNSEPLEDREKRRWANEVISCEARQEKCMLGICNISGGLCEYSACFLRRCWR